MFRVYVKEIIQQGLRVKEVQLELDETTKGTEEGFDQTKPMSSPP